MVNQEGVGVAELPAYLLAIRYVDELLLIFCFVLFLSLHVVAPRKYSIRRIPFMKWILCFIIIAFAGILINRVYLPQGVFGIYDYIKNIIIICFFSWLGFGEKEFRGMVRAICAVAVVLGLAAIAGEFAAVFFERGIGILVDDNRRFGLYRAISLTGHGSWNYLGVYASIVFFLHRAQRPKPMAYYPQALVIITLVILTFSRQTWLIFAVLFILLARRRTLVVASAAGLCIVTLLVPLYAEMLQLFLFEERMDPDRYFRLFALLESFKIFNGNPFFGIGPGMFGNLTSVLFDSPVYSNWPLSFRDFLWKIRGIDQFWPALLADAGLTGAIMYGMIFVGIFLHLRKISSDFRKDGNWAMAEMGRTLSMLIVALFLMGFFSGLNSAFVSLTYFSLAGIYISCSRNNLPQRNAQQCEIADSRAML